MSAGKRNLRKLLWTGIAASLLVIPPTLAASIRQPAGPHGARGFHGPRGEMRLLRELDLTEEQRQRVRALFEESAASGAGQRLMEARRALHEAVESGAEEAAIRELAYQVGVAEGDAAVERARLSTLIQEILTAEQQQELQQLKEERKERMEERRLRFQERMERRRNQNPGSF